MSMMSSSHRRREGDSCDRSRCCGRSARRPRSASTEASRCETAPQARKHPAVKPHRKGVRFELVSVEGNPARDEYQAILRTLEDMLETEHEGRTPSLWLRASRAQGRRLGM